MMTPQPKEDMPTATTPKIEKYVYDAIRLAGGKAADMTDEQRIRAMAAPTEKGGLTGKTLGLWILEAKNGSVQIAEARAAAANPRRAKPKEPGKMAQKYGAEIVQRAKLARGVTKKTSPTALSNHALIDTAARKVLKERGLDVDADGLAALQNKEGVQAVHDALPKAYPQDRIAESLAVWRTQLS